MNIISKFAGIAVSIAVGSACLVSVAWADPIKIRVGWNQAPGHAASFLYSNTALLPHYGKSYIVEPVRFKGSGEQITALATGDVDLAALGAAAMASAIQNAGLDVRAVADVLRDGEPGYFTHPYIVRKDSGIASVADLKGKRLATNQIGSSSDMGMRAALRAQNISDADVTSVEVNFTNQPSFLRAGTVDLISVLPQFAEDMQKDPAMRTLFTMRDSVGVTQTVALVARKDFIDKNRAALVDFFSDHIIALRHYLDPANRDEALKAISEVTLAPPESFDYALTKKDFFRDTSAKLDVDGLKRAADLAAQLGLVKPIDLTKYVDVSLVNDALAQLGQ
jgi:sulfonate transport system substrate-binding protein